MKILTSFPISCIKESKQNSFQDIRNIYYFLPETRAQITLVQQLRAEGLPLYLTIDAGPNVKLLFLEPDRAAVQAAFPALEIINPFRENNA